MPLMNLKRSQPYRPLLSLPAMVHVRDVKCGVAIVYSRAQQLHAWKAHLLSMPPAWDPLAYDGDVDRFAVRVIVECEVREGV